MKNYYIECAVSYTDKTGEIPYSDKENYSFIMQSEKLSLARYYAKIKALKQFKDEINEGFENISVDVIDCYETSEDARTS